MAAVVPDPSSIVAPLTVRVPDRGSPAPVSARPLADVLAPDWQRMPCRVLDHDRQLLAAVPEQAASEARRALLARDLLLDPGVWTPRDQLPEGSLDCWLGLLILDGLLVRTVRLGNRTCAELLGPGDLLRPWDDDAASVLDPESSWRVLEDTRVARLDEGFAHRAARWPGIAARLVERSNRRNRALSTYLAIAQARRADERLRMLFWCFADRWGRVTPDGVVVRLAITHDLIAQLACVRRPTVSLTLQELQRSGEIVRRSRDTWVLTGPPAPMPDALAGT